MNRRTRWSSFTFILLASSSGAVVVEFPVFIAVLPYSTAAP
jgi:hypothetical protein